MDTREQALWTRARLGQCGPPLDLLTARFDRHRYAPHAHDEFTIGVCVVGSEIIDYRGGRIHTGPGSIVVLAPGEVHTGGPALVPAGARGDAGGVPQQRSRRPPLTRPRLRA